MAYAQAMSDADIAVASLTDYNGIRPEWFEAIGRHAAGLSIRMLPGVELSFAWPKYGLHVLAVFSEDTDLEAINVFLRAQNADPSARLLLEDGHHNDIQSHDVPTLVIRRLREKFGCLIIPCHPDAQNGFMKSMALGEAARFIAEVAPDAIEHLKPSEFERLRSNTPIRLPGSTSLARVEFSDAHSLEEIGRKVGPGDATRSTYLKLSSVKLDALGLALHDPEMRVRVGDLPTANHARITAMAVEGSGFLGNVTIRWNDDLNVIIGGRGVGKSALIETLRYALDLGFYSDESYRRTLVDHALGSGGKVSVYLTRALGMSDTRRYVVTRVRGEEPTVLDSDSGRQLDIAPWELLGPVGGPTVLGQREVYAVSGSDEYRLALLDDLIGDDARRSSDATRQALERVKANSREIVDVLARVGKRDEYQQKSSALEHELAIYQKHGAADKLREATNLRSDGRQLKVACDALQEASSLWGTTAEGVLSSLDTALRSLGRGQSQNKSVLDTARDGLQTARNRLENLLDQGRQLLEAGNQEMGRAMSAWRELLKPLDEALNRIKQEAQTQALDPDRLLRIAEEKTALVPIIEELDRSERHLEDLDRKRVELLAYMKKCRHAEHQLRRERAEQISQLLGGRLRLEVQFKGQKADYKAHLSRILKGSAVSQDAIDCLAAPDATDGTALADAIREGNQAVKERYGLTAGMADRLVRWFVGDPARLLELEGLVPPDALRVELKVDSEYRPLDRLSAGQRATAVLLLLFALQGRILVLDQPEDDLDNRFVYEDIVQLLRDQKGSRQLILVTHNPNIPVIGDGDLVLPLEVREGKATILASASIDDRDTRDAIKAIMEGGEEAFLRRARKYGGLQANELL